MARENYNVKISLTDKQVLALGGGPNVSDRIQTTAQNAVGRIADGGVLLGESHRSRIEKIIGEISDPETIVAAVEKSAARSGDNHVMSAILDPIFYEEFKEKAHVAGVSVPALVTDLFTTALHMGLLCDMETDRQDVYFSREQVNFLRRRLELSEDQPVTGDLLARRLGWQSADEAKLSEEPAAVSA